MTKDSSYNPVVFISYIPRAKKTDLRRGVELAKARRHAAIQSHPRTVERKSTSRPFNYDEEPLQISQLTHALARSNDWYFGSLGTGSQPLTNPEFAMINIYVGRRTQLCRGMHFVEAAPFARLVMLPLLKDLVQRAVSEPCLVKSLVASTAFLTAEDYRSGTPLITIGQESTAEALRSTRSLLHHHEGSPSLELQYSMLHLCISSLAIGDAAAAKIHLTYLVEASECNVLVRKATSPEEKQLHQWLLHRIRGCDFRYALETCGLPLVHRRPKDVEVPNLASEQGYVSAEHVFNTMTGTPKDLPHHTTLNMGDSLVGVSDAGWLCDRSTGIASEQYNRRPGLHQAIDDGILSARLRSMITQYETALQCIARVASATWVGAEELLRTSDDCFIALHSLCTDWHIWHKVRQTDSTNLSAPDQTRLDRPVLLALQAHLALCMGRFLPQRLPILAIKLRSSLQQVRNLDTVTTDTGPVGISNIRTSLLLWILLVGMLSAGEMSPDCDWFRNRAASLIASLEIDSETELLRLILPFGRMEALLGARFGRMARQAIAVASDPSVGHADGDRAWMETGLIEAA